ncbi:MAG: hypothetical protein OES13_09245 [Acidimicrobiia bacterium]|nr:hypothetical protein [Acidimicrobiia bacterium]
MAEDDLSIAFRRFGQGPALVYPASSMIETVSVVADLGFDVASMATSYSR